jgi:hypothetical protein
MALGPVGWAGFVIVVVLFAASLISSTREIVGRKTARGWSLWSIFSFVTSLIMLLLLGLIVWVAYWVLPYSD